MLEIVYSVTDPPIKALRRVIPPLRIGTIALDLSFIIVMIAAYILLAIVGWSSSSERECSTASSQHLSHQSHAGATVPKEVSSAGAVPEPADVEEPRRR